MSAPGISTFDLPVPRRPSVDDCGGAQKIDDAEFPPDPLTMPCAAEFNTFAHLLAAFGRVIAAARISIEGGANPFVASLAVLGSKVNAQAFFVRSNGAGDVSITWPSKTLPTPQTAPTATINEDGPFAIAAFVIPNGVRVKTYQGTTPTNAKFTVEIC